MTNLVIDAGHLIRRVAFTPQGSLTDTQGHPSGIAHGFFSSLAFLARTYKKKATAYVAFDSGVSEFRKHLYSDYKWNREDLTADTYTGPDLGMAKDYIYAVLQIAGIPAFMKENMEADDIVAALTHQLDSAVIVSSDRDFLQLLSDKVHMFDPIKKVLYTPDDVIKKGFDESCWSEQFIFLNAIIGDKDEVPQLVPKIGETRAFPVAKALAYGCRHNSKYADQIHEHLDQLELNLQLFDLQWAFSHLKDQIRLLFEAFQPSEFSGIELEQRLVRALHKWELKQVSQQVNDLVSLRLKEIIVPQF